MQSIEDRPVHSVKPYENNPRVNDHAVDAVAASIKEFGFRTPILCDGDGVIIAGHTRLKAAKKLGLKTVPVIMADDLPPEKVQALRIADNQLASLATWDETLLELELSALQAVDYDLSILGFDEEALTRMLESGDEGDDDAEVEPTELESVQAEALSLIEECDRVVLQFSGGKDSTVARQSAQKRPPSLENRPGLPELAPPALTPPKTAVFAPEALEGDSDE
jgi:site-specific DNA-methyltransferase (adenine-specific)